MVDKDLPKDPLLRQMAKALHAQDVALGRPPLPLARLLATCVGAVTILWITAHRKVDQENVLALGPVDIDALTGLEGCCNLFPAEWLVVLDANHVKLPGFQEHRGAKAEKTAMKTARQQRWRDGKRLHGRRKTSTPVDAKRLHGRRETSTSEVLGALGSPPHRLPGRRKTST